MVSCEANGERIAGFKEFILQLAEPIDVLATDDKILVSVSLALTKVDDHNQLRGMLSVNMETEDHLEGVTVTSGDSSHQLDLILPLNLMQSCLSVSNGERLEDIVAENDEGTYNSCC